MRHFRKDVEWRIITIITWKIPANFSFPHPKPSAWFFLLMKSRIFFSKAWSSSWQLCVIFHFLSIPGLVESKISLPVTQQCMGRRKLNSPSPRLSTPKCQVPKHHTCLIVLIPCLLSLYYINGIGLAKQMEYIWDVLLLSPSQMLQNALGMMAVAVESLLLGFNVSSPHPTTPTLDSPP